MWKKWWEYEVEGRWSVKGHGYRKNRTYLGVTVMRHPTGRMVRTRDRNELGDKRGGKSMYCKKDPKLRLEETVP